MTQLLERPSATSTVLERTPYTGTQTKTKDEPAKQWLYYNLYVKDQPVKNREHVQMLLSSLDAQNWNVVFHTPEAPDLFVQAAFVGTDELNVETNVPEGGWVQRILHDGYNDVNDINSDSFGDPDKMHQNEVFTIAEATAICSAWMAKQVIPEGFVISPVEE